MGFLLGFTVSLSFRMYDLGPPPIYNIFIFLICICAYFVQHKSTYFWQMFKVMSPVAKFHTKQFIITNLAQTDPLYTISFQVSYEYNLIL